MSPKDFDSPTVGLSTSGELFRRGFEREPLSVPALTILCHPDLGRIGDRALLYGLKSGRSVQVSRIKPAFSAVGQERAEPLGDPYLSRTPFRFQRLGEGGVRLCLDGSRTRISAEGAPVETEAEFTEEQVDRGVVVELSRRVVLLLHNITPVEESDARRFELIGESAEIARAREDIRRVADLDVTVLIRGETGTGKELVARAIHESSPRRKRPFVSVSLAALTPSLAAAELFGALKGSYTGAVRDQEGYFREAEGGTLFLDEIGEAPHEIQVMLLRVLESRRIHPLGSPKAIEVDVRVVAATDTELERRVQSGEFKEPLIHRLSGYVIWLAPLRRRREDIGRLLVHFLRLEAREIGEQRRLEPNPAILPWLPAGLVVRLARFSWPGNVRQLLNVARQLVISNRGRSQLALDAQIERLLSEPPPAEPKTDAERSAPDGPPAAPRRKPSEIEEEELLTVLRTNRWDLAASARQLAVSRASLYNLIRDSDKIRTAADLTPDEIIQCHKECGGDLLKMTERLEVSLPALRRRVRALKLQ